MSEIEHRIERAIAEGEEVLIGKLGDPPDEEAWADLADQVIGDLADDYRGAVEALEQARDAMHRLCLERGSTDGYRADFARINAHLGGQ